MPSKTLLKCYVENRLLLIKKEEKVRKKARRDHK